jgi:hypothetical protein
MRNRQIQIRVIGGLGNQLFVYFAGLYLSGVSGRKLVLDLKDTSRVHSPYDLRSFEEISKELVKNEDKTRNQILGHVIDSYRFRFPRVARISDKILGNYFDNGIEANVLLAKGRKKTIKFSGYFQDFQYLDCHENFNMTLSSPIANSPRLEEENVLGIHIRRGDFINEKMTHGCLDVSWYRQATDYQLQINPEAKKIKVFSNDSEWVTSNINSIYSGKEIPVEIVDFDKLQDPAISFLDFASCTYRVCSNSTFSLLASYLVPGKTVVPFPYNRSGNFKALEDSSPLSWVRIPSIWEH